MRSISCVVVIALIAATALPAAVSPATAMPCCHGDAAMSCCLPSADCTIRSCPGGEHAALLPALPPALLGSAVAEAVLAPRPETLRSLSIVIVTLAPAPPDEPPRG